MIHHWPYLCCFYFMSKQIQESSPCQPTYLPLLFLIKESYFFAPGVQHLPWRADFGQCYLSSVPWLFFLCVFPHPSYVLCLSLQIFVSFVKDRVCFLFSFLLLGDFQENSLSFRGRNTNQKFHQYFFVLCGLLIYSFYLLIISACSKHTNNPITSTPISTCLLLFLLLLPVDSCSPHVFLFKLFETTWLVQLITVIIIWIEFLFSQILGKPLDQVPFTGQVAVDQGPSTTQQRICSLGLSS